MVEFRARMIADKLAEVECLTTNIAESLNIRKKLCLPMTGTVKVKKVKPNGVSIYETTSHIVRIYVDDDLIDAMTLPEFHRRMNIGADSEFDPIKDL